ncbi:lipopolysaccharide biosynthesis protein [Planococcus beigongshangi]|uniref:lipopolysaccharide biosynthesis protein n=1 Tax=Planococcus beigongshangi TaxID=2782536 RepID=UPI00193AEECB|nr:oligosaccharide flippase family protein [Planococcus beigongshangi]
MKNAILSKFLNFSYGSWVGLVIGLLTTMIVTRILPVEAFGMASMYILFIQVGMIITIFGTDQAFVRFFYEETEDKRGMLLYNVLRFPFLNSIIVIIIVLIFYRPISLFLFGFESIFLGLLLVFGIVMQILLRYSQLVIRMQQRANLFSILQIIQKFLILIFTILFFYFYKESFIILVYSELVSLIIIVIISIVLSQKYWNISNIKNNSMKHTQKDILKYSIPFMFTILITWLFEAFDKIALRQWSNFEELGLYTAAMKLVSLVLVLKGTFSTFWTPVAFEKFENDPGNLDFFRNISVAVSFAMFFVAIISIAGKDLIIILLGSEYKEAALIMPFLVFMPVLYTISETTVIGINFYKKINWHILIALICCIFNIFGNWLLVPAYGAVGASIATALSFVIFFSIRTHISLKYFKIKYPLKRIYSMIIVISLYASVSITLENIWTNFFYGVIAMTVLILLFYKDLVDFYKIRK